MQHFHFYFKVFVLLLFLKLLPGTVAAQQFYRIKADFSIKEKQANGGSQLIVGTVYYDKAVKKIVYNITFPKAETWVIQDTTLWKIANNKVISKQKSFMAPAFSIFHYALNGQLADYGLKNSTYKIGAVDKEGNMIVTTWLPEPRLRKHMGKVVMSNINKRLFGLVYYNVAEEIMSKQFFKNYTNVNGCEFPGEITQITYLKNGQNYQVTSYKNVVVDEKGEKTNYNFALPK